MAWQIAHGETPDNIRNHPALKGVTIPRTGRQGRIGTLVTKTLVVAGEGGQCSHCPTAAAARCCGPTTRPAARRWASVYMPAPQSGSPMTYLHNGQQYIVLAISAPPNLAARADRVQAAAES